MQINKELTALSLLLLLGFGLCGGFDLSLHLELQDPFVFENNEICSVESGCLETVGPVTFSGFDKLGEFQGSSWDAITSTGAIVQFSLRDYGNFQIYQQYFLDGLNGTSCNDTNGVSTGWPVFRIPNDTEAPGLRYVTPGGYMTGWTLYAQGSVKDDIHRFRDGESGGLVGLILPYNDTYPNVMMSAFTEPMAANVKLVSSDNLYLQWGIQGLAENIPPGYSIQFISISHGSSFNKNVMAWGQVLQNYFDSQKLQNDFSNDYIGYWTDDGAAHYYNPSPYLSYQNMIMDIYNYTVVNKIPIRYLQIDSWWYYKGEGGGVKNWTAKPYIFPDGIEYISAETGWPIVAHNRYFSNDTVYAIQNGGDYPFTIDYSTSMALPLDKRFWDDLFDEALQWGLYTYEQDWLDRQYESTSALHTNITLGSSWPNNFGQSALERDIKVQYCMSFPRHFIHSVQLDAVTQIRVSDDYMVTPEQWRIGMTSLFAHALNLKPYKDVFWSSRDNKNTLFADCQLLAPYDLQHPLLNLRHMYGGRQAVTRNNETCVAWTLFGYDVKYPHSGMRLNLCRNPLDTKRRGAFCFTHADFDIPESEWLDDLCNPPNCDLDCYFLNGVGYIGGHSITQNGSSCVDWNGEYGINGSKCRNPTHEEAPWCYVTEDHTEREFCNNKCTEAAEPNSELQSAISTLSTGPVGVGDRAENLNKNLIMKSVRSDGLILKPSQPLIAIDLAFMSKDYREVWTSSSSISGYLFGIIFLAEIEQTLTLTDFDLNLEKALETDVILYQNYPVEISSIQIVLAEGNIILPPCGGALNFCLWYTSPLLSINSDRIAVLGEVSKWTPLSPQRLSSITANESDIELLVSGIMNETISFVFWSESNNQTFTITCYFITDGTMNISVNSRVCD